ncbi:hypothetical protein [Micromonospora deserti]|uniref:Uncharacterized protein n=1 Tax=Micromonospora deserti TaxID=2070366 RepID=A0A2W2BRH6_9ACTN|nr:hypothetical protein [Micromonospora deserti]PZF83014.1 hypothetical protein C1I99_31230 [Micromonospora deserti]
MSEPGARPAPARLTWGRRLVAAVAALAVLLPIAACAEDTPVSPLPVRPPSPALPARSPSPTPPDPSAPTAVTPTVRRPVPAPPEPTRSTRPSAPSPTGLPSACLGPVRYDLVLAEIELALVKSLCFAAGGVLRVVGIGPGEVTVDREELVSRSYEAGVVDIRFVRTGTVTVTIPQNGTAYPITVVVV